MAPRTPVSTKTEIRKERGSLSGLMVAGTREISTRTISAELESTTGRTVGFSRANGRTTR